MNRRLFMRALLGGGAMAVGGMLGLRSCAMTEKKAKRDFESFFPEPVHVDEVGWERFLSLWSDQAMALVRRRLLAQGLGLGPRGRGLRKGLEEKSIHLPPEVFAGGLPYPPQTEIDQTKAESVLKLMIESIPEIKRHEPYWPKNFYREALVNGGLRHAHASGQTIAEAERRLGLNLPKSYREFLSLSNGWLALDDDFLPIEQVKRMQDAAPDLVWTWTDGGRAMNILDEEYLQYDLGKQDPARIRFQHLADCLMLSEHYGVSSRWYLLNPAIRFEDGEWEAWHLETRIAGARRFRSFKAMMEWLYTFEIAELRMAVYEMD